MQIKKRLSFLLFFCYSLLQKNPAQHDTNKINQIILNSKTEEKIKKADKLKKRIFNNRTGFNLNNFSRYALFILIIFLIFLIIKFYPKPEKDLIILIQKLKPETKTRSLQEPIFKHINLKQCFQKYGLCFFYIGLDAVYIFDKAWNVCWCLDKEFFYHSKKGNEAIFGQKLFYHGVIDLIDNIIEKKSLKKKLYQIKLNFKNTFIKEEDFLNFYSEIFFCGRQFFRRRKDTKQLIFPGYCFFSTYYSCVVRAYSQKNKLHEGYLFLNKNFKLQFDRLNHTLTDSVFSEKLFLDLSKKLLNKNFVITFCWDIGVLSMGKNFYLNEFSEVQNPLIKYLTKIKSFHLSNYFQFKIIEKKQKEKILKKMEENDIFKFSPENKTLDLFNPYIMKSLILTEEEALKCLIEEYGNAIPYP